MVPDHRRRPSGRGGRGRAARGRTANRRAPSGAGENDVSVVASLYRAALHLMPSAPRAEPGAEMEALFDQELRDPRARGRVAVIRVSLAAFADLGARAAYERLRPRVRPRTPSNEASM